MSHIIKPKWLRIAFRIFAVFAGLIVVFWLSLAAYIDTHKKELLAKITDQINDKIDGELIIGSMTPSLWRSFPDVSIELKDVALRDSMYDVHHHNLFEAKELFVKVNTLRLLFKTTEIKKLTAVHGSVYFYVDSTGYTNMYLIKKKKVVGNNAKIKTTKAALIDNFALEDIHFRLDERKKKKLFSFDFKNVDGAMQLVPEGVKIHLITAAHINSFTFNESHGSFLKNQDVNIDAALFYDPVQKRIYFPEQEIVVGGQPLLFTGTFFPTILPFAFDIRVRYPAINYQLASQFLSHNITLKLGMYSLSEPVNVDAHIDGIKPFVGTPLIHVKWTAKNTNVGTPFAQIANADFNGYYSNEVVKNSGHGDDNSAIHFTSFSGTWNQIPIKADSIVITNLIDPWLDMSFNSNFPLTTLNGSIGGNVLHFSEGSASANLHYKGGMLSTDTLPYTLYGTLQIQKGALTYMPYKFDFTNVGAKLLFTGDNLYFSEMTMSSKQSSLSLEGSALHFLRLYFTNPDKVTINLKLRSPSINLNEFKAIISGNKKKEVVVKGNANSGLNRIGNQLGPVLDASTINFDAMIDRITYNHFVATNIKANTFLTKEGIKVEKVHLEHSGGTIDLDASINQFQPNRPFAVKAKLQHISVAGIFKAFDNFDQDGIVADNLEGTLGATADITGRLSDQGGLVKNSIHGTVDFRLEDGALKNFQPFVKISKFVFRKRNLSDITFKDIHDKLTIEGSRIVINPMLLQSSAINLQLQGIYGMEKGTDIFIEIPLRNPKNDAEDMNDSAKLNKKGIVVYLRAQSVDTTGVKISWDPMKKGKDVLNEDLMK